MRSVMFGMLILMLLPVVHGAHMLDAGPEGYEIDALWSTDLETLEQRSGRDLVLVESFSATWCQACIETDPVLDELATTDPDVVLVRYHPDPDPGDPLGVPGNLDRQVDLYRGTGFPLTVIGGREEIEGVPSTPVRFLDAVEKVREYDGTATITGTATVSNGRIEVDLLGSGTGTMVVLLVEKLVNFTGSNGLADHRQVVRHWFHNGAPGQIQGNVTMDVRWGDDLEIVAFIQAAAGEGVDLSEIGFAHRPLWLGAGLILFLVAGTWIFKPFRFSEYTPAPRLSG